MSEDETWSLEPDYGDLEVLQELDSMLDEQILLAPFSWGSQDLQDWSKEPAIFVTLSIGIPGPVSSLPTELRWKISGELGPEFESAVREALREQGLDKWTANQNADYYQVGPTAESIPHYVVTLWEHRDEIGLALSSLADAYAVTDLSRRVVGKMKDWLTSAEAPQVDLVVYFPIGILVAYCEQYVREQYHPRAKLSSSWYPLQQGFFESISTPAHPTNLLEYLILVKTSKEEYIFKLDSAANVSFLMLKKGSVKSRLPVPAQLAAFEPKN